MEERDLLYFKNITDTNYREWPLFKKKDKSSFIRKCIFNNETEVPEGKQSLYKFVDDKYLVKDNTLGFKITIALLLISVFVFLGIILSHSEVLFEEFLSTFFFLVFSIVVICLGYYIVFKSSYTFIYNRLDGTITMPRWFSEKSYTMPFDNILFSINCGQMGSCQLYIHHPRFWTFGTYGGDPEADISFITWFMDKNRPLPPGKAFDPYRQRDYERRKAEGFPDPLYPSHIITEEYKPELTIESHQGKLLNIETIGRESGSEWYNPNKHMGWVSIRYIKDKHDISPLQYELIRYEFEDGKVIYARTTGNGEVARPPETETFTESKIVGAALKFAEERPKEKSVADRWEDRNF